MLIKLAKHGAILFGRDIARELREQVESALDRGERIQFDCAGVVCIGRAYADELWGKLVEDRGKRVLRQMHFTSLDPFVKLCIGLGIVGRWPGVSEEAVREGAE